MEEEANRVEMVEASSRTYRAEAAAFLSEKRHPAGKWLHGVKLGNVWGKGEGGRL